MRTVGRYDAARELTRAAGSASSNGTMGSPGNTYFRHLAQIEHLVNLVRRENTLALHQVANCVWRYTGVGGIVTDAEDSTLVHSASSSAVPRQAPDVPFHAITSHTCVG